MISSQNQKKSLHIGSGGTEVPPMMQTAVGTRGSQSSLDS